MDRSTAFLQNSPSSSLNSVFEYTGPRITPNNMPKSNLDSMVFYTGPQIPPKKSLVKQQPRISASTGPPLSLVISRCLSPLTEVTPEPMLSDCDTPATTITLDDLSFHDRQTYTERGPTQPVTKQVVSAVQPTTPATARRGNGQPLANSEDVRAQALGRAAVNRPGKVLKRIRNPTAGYRRQSRPVGGMTRALPGVPWNTERVTTTPPSQPTWVVHKIIDRDFDVQGRCIYRVVWEDTWEPAAALQDTAADAIAEWEASVLRG